MIPRESVHTSDMILLETWILESSNCHKNMPHQNPYCATQYVVVAPIHSFSIETLGPTYSAAFARLVPINKTALIVFERIVSKLMADSAENGHTQKSIGVNPQRGPIIS